MHGAIRAKKIGGNAGYSTAIPRSLTKLRSYTT
uniref:Uncharacterized protein n=1 Tax=Arundo donax TaxID=35708 RepID=A0A0A9C8W7_ARUDO